MTEQLLNHSLKANKQGNKIMEQFIEEQITIVKTFVNQNSYLKSKLDFAECVIRFYSDISLLMQCFELDKETAENLSVKAKKYLTLYPL